MSDGGWTVAALAAEDGEYMLRTRARLPEAADRARLPLAIWISWAWGPITSEAAEDAVIERMIAFENAVCAAAEAGGWGLLVAVLTNGHGRDWLWYAADRAAFVAGMQAALAAHPVYPFEVRAWDDPDWRAARELNPRGLMH